MVRRKCSGISRSYLGLNLSVDEIVQQLFIEHLTTVGIY